MARPRQNGSRNLPEYLYFCARDGYILTLVNGARKNIGRDKHVAIQVAVEYNRIMRPKVAITVDGLILASASSSKGERPIALGFAHHVDKLLETIIHEEQPSKELIATWRLDSERIKEFFANIPAPEITLNSINDYLEKYHPNASANVQNRKVSFFQKLFSYAMDNSLMINNPAKLKRRKRTEKKKRGRLSIANYKKIYAAAPLWLKTAMALSLQTTHARLEVSRIKYRINKPDTGVCGCIWYSKPKQTPEGMIFGTLYIHRQKVQEHEASYVAVPIGTALNEIIEASRSDKLICPYIVHREPERRTKQSEKTDHPYQLTDDYISRGFSSVRDQLGLYNHIPIEERPTYHEIRALSGRLYHDQGVDPQARMAHTDAKSTRVYVENHHEWTEVPHAEIAI